METISVSVVLDGLLKKIKPSVDFLAPVTECFLNSLESIEIRRKAEPNLVGVVNIRLNVGASLEARDELYSIEIEDNGIGFTDEHTRRFKYVFDTTKGFNNRGSGRVQILHRFHNTEVDSLFVESGKTKKRHFKFDSAYFVYEESIADADIAPDAIHTTIKMNSPYRDVDKFNLLTADDLKKVLLEKFMLKFFLLGDKLPKISITKVDNTSNLVMESVEIQFSDLVKPFLEGTIKVPYKRYVMRDGKYVWVDEPSKVATIYLSHFKVQETDILNNGINVCAKHTMVERLDIPSLKNKSSINGHRYITTACGDELDQNVSDSVDRFTLATKDGVEGGEVPLSEDGTFLIYDDIKEAVISATLKAHTELQQAFQEQRKRVEQIAVQHGIQEDIVNDIKLDIGDKERNIVEKLYKAQAQKVASLNYKIQETYTELNNLDPSQPNYQTELRQKSDEILKLIPLQDKEELARYIIRRDMVIAILKKAVNNELTVQSKEGRKDNEGLIHDIIFKRKSENTEELNDLWFLNEEFVHFKGCSEIELSQVCSEDGRKVFADEIESDVTLQELKIKRLAKRPDILLFPEEGKVVVIEFKAPNVDVSAHLDQISKYCTLIETFARPDLNITQFFGYLIGENIEPIDVPSRFQKASYGKSWFNPLETVRNFKTEVSKHLYLEILTYSSLVERATIRNKNFADKLNIRIPPKA